MFKTLAKWIGAIPWWLLLLGGPALIVTAGIVTSKTQTHKLVDSADTPELKAAIRREIKRAEEQVALNIGRSAVLKIQSVTSNPELQAELEQALEEIDQAQEDLADARAEADSARKEADVAAQDAMKEGAAARREAKRTLKRAETDLARAKTKLEERLKLAKEMTKGVDASKDAGHKDGKAGSITSGADGKPAAEVDPAKPSTRSTIEGLPTDKPAAEAPPDASGRAAETKKPDTDSEDKISLDIGNGPGKKLLQIDLGLADVPTPPVAPLPPLPPELRAEIGSQVQRDVTRVVIGSTAVVALVLLFIALIISKSVISVNRALKTRATRSEQAAQQASLSRQLMEAKLAAMQAQIEPHFLFNTLASVDHLIETDPPAASRMQKNLIAYLRAAIPQMRESTTTLGREAEMCRAYLNILQVRMESRLKFDIAVAEELKNLSFPPMMLPTLTENAIKHGLEAKSEGGEIRISAVRAGEKLRVAVCDTGMGFSEKPGSGVGLTNIHERLQALYGKAAQLIIEPNLPYGTIATIEIPYPNGKGHHR